MYISGIIIFSLGRSDQIVIFIIYICIFKLLTSILKSYLKSQHLQNLMSNIWTTYCRRLGIKCCFYRFCPLIFTIAVLSKQPRTYIISTVCEIMKARNSTVRLELINPLLDSNKTCSQCFHHVRVNISLFYIILLHFIYENIVFRCTIRLMSPIHKSQSFNVSHTKIPET